MNWYSGNIAEAVNLSKSKNAIFVVYVEGTDDLSQKLTNFINDPKICKLLDSELFVGIKIQSGSDAYMQFAQIYQLVPLPSLFFIGKNGTPLEVVTGITATVEELEQKIKNVLERTGKEKRDELLLGQNTATSTTFPTSSNNQASTSSSSANLISSEQVNQQSTSDVVCKDGVCFKKSTEEDHQQSPEEKLERAKEIIEKKRKEKEDADAEAEKEREVRRRKEGQDVLNLKKWQEDQEIKQLKDDRKREKLEEQAVRKRILEQIEQDKAERAQRFGLITNSSSTNNENTSNTPKPATTPKSENSEFARIQFKKPGGDTEMHIFNSTDKFQIVRNYVQDTVLVGTGVKDFTLATTFPRKEYSAVENEQTLIDLGLSPTAVLLILPKFNTNSNQNTVVDATKGIFDIATAVIWNIFTPLMAVYGYIRNLIFARRENVDSGAQKRANESSDNVSDNDAAKRRNISRFQDESPKPSTSNERSGAYKRVGGSNIHRLRESRSDSDDENNTWNGNSTQQQ